MKCLNYKVSDIAEYIIYRAIDMNEPVSNLSLQKILYYVQAASIGERGKSLFEEPIVAWRYGPVIECIYQKYKHYVDNRIDDLSIEDLSYIDEIDDTSKSIIERVLEAKRSCHPYELVKDTHSEDPWIDTWDSGNGQNVEISIGALKKYFSGDNLKGIYERKKA